MLIEAAKNRKPCNYLLLHTYRYHRSVAYSFISWNFKFFLGLLDCVLLPKKALKASKIFARIPRILSHVVLELPNGVGS